MKISKEGFPYIVPFFVLSILSLLLGQRLIFAIFIILTLCFSFFFRNPKRQIPQDNNAILSPADGRIIKIKNLKLLPFSSSSGIVVSIFLSLLDVHIIRAPLSGQVNKVEHSPGNFFPAYKEEAGTKNKSISVFLKGHEKHILIRQIAGFTVRRIKCFVKKNDKVTSGQKIGLIYFGSRVDIFLPRSVQIKINLRQKVKAGETKIAEIIT